MFVILLYRYAVILLYCYTVIPFINTFHLNLRMGDMGKPLQVSITYFDAVAKEGNP